MEDEIAVSDFVLIVCTPEYARKSNDRAGGVGYEQQIISGHLVHGLSRSKFVPIVRSGNIRPGPNCSVPPHFMGVASLDFTRDAEFQIKLEDLLRVIWSRPKFAPPPLGKSPDLTTQTTTSQAAFSNSVLGRSTNEAISQTDFASLGKMSKEEIHRSMNQFKSMITFEVENGDAYYSLGLCYLQLKLHDLAIKNFKEALGLMPEYPDVYYYLGLSLIRGRRPKTMSLKEIRQIEEYVETAIQLDSQQAKYYCLAAILKFDYYAANGLSVSTPSSYELLQIARSKDSDPWEIERLLQAIVLRNENFISQIREI